jgi:hypothetical protein
MTSPRPGGGVGARPSRALARSLAAMLVAMGVSWALPADAYQPVLHELIPPDDGEDLALAVTTAEGDLPAAIETRSGVVRAPETQRVPSSKESAYREPLLPNAPPTYRPDRDTRRPSMVRYDDPFSPSIAPYKRLRAYDAVGPDYALKVRDSSLTRVPSGGSAKVGEEEFYADLTVDFAVASTVLIPSVGPGARVLAEHATPPIPIEVWRDGADNWYAKAPSSQRGRVHLVMQVAIARGAFGGEFTMPPWSGLSVPAPLPGNATRAFSKVRDALGLTRDLSPAENLKKLVAYFRSFSPSEEPPRASDDIYLDLTLSQKGVCRHRAFGFLVTALGLGIPARMVMNEAHAWVEVQTDRLWERIDLGGAAGAIEEGFSESRPSYDPPADPFGWPPSAESGSGHEVASRSRQITPGESSSSRSSSSAAADTSSPPGSAVRPADRVAEASPGLTDDRARARVVVRGADVQVHRGAPVHIAGKVDVDGTGCSLVRVDVMLQGSSTKGNLGSLVTDQEGMFDGNLFLPLAFPVGDYEVTASTPGDARCGPGTSEH